MKFKTVILTLISCLFISCQQRVAKGDKLTNADKVEIELSKKHDYKLDWRNAVNENNSSEIHEMYDDNAIMVVTQDKILNTSKAIAEHYTNTKYKITTIESLFEVEASKDGRIKYEINKYETVNHKEFAQVVIWKLENENWVREFEFTERSNSDSINVEINEIEESRRLWMKLCNENNAGKLIRQLYCHNTLYYNHKPLIQGTENLIKEYAYMNDTNYNLILLPLKLEIVNANMAFEIGQCKGSYNGKYIIVWKRELDGTWRIIIDSNI